MKSLLRAVVCVALAGAAAAHAAPAQAPAAASAPARETWALGTYNNGQGTVICRYILDLGPKADEQLQQPERVTLTWLYDADANNGMPTDDDKTRMDELEDALAAVVERDGFSNLALVATGAGSRSWTYYARSGDEFLARTKQALRDRTAYPVKVEVVPDPGWGGFEAFVRDALH